jgi:hypothetical protein
MYEFTMGGWWFRWSALDMASRRLAAASMAFALVATFPVSLSLGRLAYTIGQCVGSGDWSLCAAATTRELSPLLAVLGTVSAIVSGILWWRFSKRQDEMFNRVQNWALGTAGAWTGGAIMIWSILALGGLLPEAPLWSGALLYVLLLFVFWWVAVRRWAY